MNPCPVERGTPVAVMAGEGNAEMVVPLGNRAVHTTALCLLGSEAGLLLRSFVRRKEIKHLQDS